MVPCPSDLQLELLLEESLHDHDRVNIEQHVEGCGSCVERLEMLVDCLDGASTARHKNWMGAVTRTDLPNGASHAGNGPAPVAAASWDWLPGSGAPQAAPAGDYPNLPGYEILGELGRGGMGVVYRARQRHLNRIVAVKMVRSGNSDLGEVARIRIEAEAVAQLAHPNIVQIYEVGEHHGLPYFSMEFVEGGTLDDQLARTPQAPRLAAEIVETLARTIHVAHQRGVVHRDLKPTNVLVAQGQGLQPLAFGTLKICDFGLAKQVQVESGLTQSGMIIGSPSYMSPEQARANSRLVGPASDTWALGIILYEMLTGRPPFLGNDPIDTLRLVATEDPVPPSRLQPKVPRDLEIICLKCLQKEPHRRYATAEDLADDLRRFRSDETIRARPASRRERAWKWARRRPTAAASIVFALLTTLAAAGAGTGYALEARAAERREAERVQAVRTESHAALLAGQRYLGQSDWNNARVTLATLCARLADEPQLTDVLQEAQALLDLADRAETDRRSYAAFRRLRAEALFHHFQVSGLNAASNIKGTRKAAATALRIFTRPESWNLAPLPAVLTPVERGEVTEGCYELLLVLAGALAQPLASENPGTQARAGLNVLARANELRPATQAYHGCRAACLERLGDPSAAAEARQQADRLPPTTTFDHFLLGQELCKRRQLAAAAQRFDLVLQQEPGHFWARCLLAICQLRDKKPETARVALTACLDREPGLVWLYLLRGFAASELGAAKQAEGVRNTELAREAAAHFEAAESDYRQVLRLRPDDDLRYILLLNRGSMRFQRQAWAEARADFQDAIGLKPALFNAYASLAQVCQQQGQREEAVRQLTTAIQLQPDLAALYRTRAYLYLNDPQLSSARRDAVLADLDEAIRREQPGSLDVADDQARRGLLLHRAQRYEDALRAYDAAVQIAPTHAEAHRLRLATLLELRRYDEVLRSSDIALSRGKPTAHLYEMRGLARAGRQDLAGAIEDYTQALALAPSAEALRRYRGWAYLVTEAHRLALHDFEAALKLDPGSGDAYSGRGYARVKLGQYAQGVADAEESLRRGGRKQRLLYNAARTLAQAAAGIETRSDGRTAAAHQQRRQYEQRACDLLAEAMEQVPSEQRSAYWRDVVRKDSALIGLRRGPAFVQLTGKFERVGQ